MFGRCLWTTVEVELDELTHRCLFGFCFELGVTEEVLVFSGFDSFGIISSFENSSSLVSSAASDSSRGPILELTVFGGGGGTPSAC